MKIEIITYVTISHGMPLYVTETRQLFIVAVKCKRGELPQYEEIVNIREFLIFISWQSCEILLFIAVSGFEITGTLMHPDVNWPTVGFSFTETQNSECRLFLAIFNQNIIEMKWNETQVWTFFLKIFIFFKVEHFSISEESYRKNSLPIVAIVTTLVFQTRNNTA